MAVKFRQIGFKVYDQLTNGTTFNQNLTKYKDNLAGYVGGRYKVINDFAVSVYWVSNKLGQKLNNNLILMIIG